MRALLNFTLSFGRLAIPVGLVSTHVDGDVGFKTLHRPCQTPIRVQTVCPSCDQVVEDGDEVVKGFEVAEGQFVVFEVDELQASVDDSRAIEVVGFVPAEDLDPIEFERGYYLKPSSKSLMRRPYALLARVLAETGTVGVAQITAWQSEYDAVLRPVAGGALVLHLLRPREDRVSPEPIEQLLVDVDLAQPEIDLARELVGCLGRDPQTVGLSSRKRARIRGLVEAKLAGREILRVEPEPVEEKPVELDLAGALRTSIAETKKKPRPKRRRKAPAKV